MIIIQNNISKVKSIDKLFVKYIGVLLTKVCYIYGRRIQGEAQFPFCAFFVAAGLISLAAQGVPVPAFSAGTPLLNYQGLKGKADQKAGLREWRKQNERQAHQ